MLKIDDDIINTNVMMCKTIDAFDDPDVLSYNLLNTLRNLVEEVCIKEYGASIDEDFGATAPQDIRRAAIRFAGSKAKTMFIYKFHSCLQKSVSHTDHDEESAQRLMLKYYDYLMQLKSYLMDNYQIDILSNLCLSKIVREEKDDPFYNEVAIALNRINMREPSNLLNDRFYVHRIKAFVVKGKMYYEITLSPANDYSTKGNRLVIYSDKKTTDYYAVKISYVNATINLLGQRVPILILISWSVSIRQCEFKNFQLILDNRDLIGTNSNEYKNLMTILTDKRINLLDIIRLCKEDYRGYLNLIKQSAKNHDLSKLLTICRKILGSDKPGVNIITYLLLHLNNVVLKGQYKSMPNDRLSYYCLKNECIPFDQMPIATSLSHHNIEFGDIKECFQFDGREHELFAREISRLCDSNKQIYVPVEALSDFGDIDQLIYDFNNSLYLPKHWERKLINTGEYVFILGYECCTSTILSHLLALEDNEQKRLQIKAADSKTYQSIDSNEKRSFLSSMFSISNIELVYGAAGTGKTKLIECVSEIFAENQMTVTFLSQTNSAIDNLRRRIPIANQQNSFTIYSYIRSRALPHTDLLVIDECSAICNADMKKLLSRSSFDYLMLVGDIFQLESISFGNWFYLIQNFLPKQNVHVLEEQYRSANDNLLKLWNQVRKLEDTILEESIIGDFVHILDKNIFRKRDEDEIILCLNYDGLYGINNINKYLQISNKNKAVYWKGGMYKVGDPILFNETKRFSDIIYNNMKGTIMGIDKQEDKIIFDIKIDKLEESDVELLCWASDVSIVTNDDTSVTVIRFPVYLPSNDDADDNDEVAIVPFQLSYALSIHKAQGLEYNSVKIVFTDDISENITQNILYTAISRAKEKLSIYCPIKSFELILENLKPRFNNVDTNILSAKFKLKVYE